MPFAPNGQLDARMPARKPAREQLEHQRRLRYLQRLQLEVTELRRQLGGVNEETRGLLAIQETRPLSAAETQRGRTLSRESERLRWELQRLFAEFEQVRAAKPGRRSP